MRQELKLGELDGRATCGGNRGSGSSAGSFCRSAAICHASRLTGENASPITFHEPALSVVEGSLITYFLIDTPAIRSVFNSLACNKNVHSNRHSSRSFKLHQYAAFAPELCNLIQAKKPSMR